MSVIDYFDVTWSPSRGLAVVRSTLGEIPPEETDEAAHQLLACGNLARRINTPPAKREAEGMTAMCEACRHSPASHSIKVGGGRGGCHVTDCPCVGFVDD